MLCSYFLGDNDRENTYLSRVAARIYLPFGENLTNDTGGFSSSKRKTRVCYNACGNKRKYNVSIIRLAIQLQKNLLETSCRLVLILIDMRNLVDICNYVGQGIS